MESVMKPENYQNLEALIKSFRDCENPDWSVLENAVSDNLRRIAFHIAGYSSSEASFGATDLVQEAFVRLLSKNRLCEFKDVSHFFGYFATTMNRLFIDRYHKNKTQKRGGQLHAIDFDIIVSTLSKSVENFEELYEVLELLEDIESRQATIIRMRFFLFFTIKEIMAATGIAKATVESDLRKARAFIGFHLGEFEPEQAPALALET